MSDQPGFTDRQLALILKRAANLQAAGDENRHSLEDIRQIASQVGIPAELVNRAASEIVEGRTASSLLGPETSFHASGTIPRRVEPADYPELLALLRSKVKNPGFTSEVPGSLEWRGDARYYSVLVTVTPGETETSVAVQGEYARERNGVYAAFVATPTALALVGATAAMESGQLSLALAAFLGVGALAFGAVRILWTYVARANQREVRELRDALVQQVSRRG